MTDLSDLRRRAAQQAGYGNYWAGKALGLCDRLDEAEALLARCDDWLNCRVEFHPHSVAPILELRRDVAGYCGTVARLNEVPPQPSEVERERDALRRLVADAHRLHPTSLAWCEVTGEMDAALQRALDACDSSTPTEER